MESGQTITDTIRLPRHLVRFSALIEAARQGRLTTGPVRVKLGGAWWCTYDANRVTLEVVAWPAKFPSQVEDIVTVLEQIADMRDAYQKRMELL